MIPEVLDFRAVDLVDVDGRPCGELASSHYDAASTEVVTCRYAGVRHGGLMNASALRQLAAVWPSLLGSAAALAGPEATVFAAYRAAVAATSAPLVFRAHHPDQPIPRLLSALFKASLGFTQVLSALMLAADGVADAPLAGLGDGDEFLACLDAQQWLLGEHQVCAGSAPMIAAMFNALCGRSEPALAPSLAMDASRIDAAVDAIGAQIAYVLVLDDLAARGVAVQAARGARWRTAPAAPWLRGIRLQPGRTPAHARRMFPGQAVPASVEQMIAGADVGLDHVDATLAALLA